jgi:hypothetical protein
VIVVELVGGLGNQMFQYAAARTLADRLGTDLGLDLRPFAAPDARPYLLGRFTIRATAIDERELLGAHGPRSLKRRVTTGALERLRLLTRRPRPRFSTATRIVHQGPTYSDVLERATDHSWVSGYWQSEAYFPRAARTLRADFTLRSLSPGSTAIARRLASMSYPVAVHVRRGDYAHVASTRAHHGLCSESYYRSAIALVRSRVPDATFIFFSDEPDWVADHLGSEAALVVTENADRPEEDLYLMTRCRSHVIANSSFSWWGAWLARSDEVIAPRAWYQAPGLDGRDIVPARWGRL